MRAKECRVNVDRLLLVQLVQDFKRLQLAFPIESVTALGFNCSCPMSRELAEVHSCARFQPLRWRPPEILDRGANAATRSRDFLIRRAGVSLFIFHRTAGGENKMRV